MKHLLPKVRHLITVRMVNRLLSLVAKPLVRDTDETLDKIVSEGVSISRFGDGEFKIMYGESLFFQQSEPELRQRLRQVLRANLDNHVVGIPNVFGSLARFTDKAKRHWQGYLRDNRLAIYKLLNFRAEYYDTQMTRLYIDYKDKSRTEARFQKIRNLWSNREVVIIEGTQSRLGVGNDFLNNAKVIERILCPPKNAFSSYEDILKEAKKQDKSRLILIALGPTATVLAYDLSRCGYQAVDIGHIDIEYEWFLNKSSDKHRVNNKYVNEVPGGDIVGELLDDEYNKQIICEIL